MRETADGEYNSEKKKQQIIMTILTAASKCIVVRSQTGRDLLKDTHTLGCRAVLLKYRFNDWISVSSFVDSVIVGLQAVRSIDFLSDAMKPSVPSLGKLAGWEGGKYNMAHLIKLPIWEQPWSRKIKNTVLFKQQTEIKPFWAMEDFSFDYIWNLYYLNPGKKDNIDKIFLFNVSLIIILELMWNRTLDFLPLFLSFLSVSLKT